MKASSLTLPGCAVLCCTELCRTVPCRTPQVRGAAVLQRGAAPLVEFMAARLLQPARGDSLLLAQAEDLSRGGGANAAFVKLRDQQVGRGGLLQGKCRSCCDRIVALWVGRLGWGGSPGVGKVQVVL